MAIGLNRPREVIGLLTKTDHHRFALVRTVGIVLVYSRGTQFSATYPMSYRNTNMVSKVGQVGVCREVVEFEEFTSAVQQDLYRLFYHTKLSAQQEDGLRNRWCAAA